MRYNVLILAEAEHDLDDAYIWYELNQNGLGKRFFQSVDESVKFLSEDPFVFAEIYDGLRRSLIKKFPYGIYYKVLLEMKEIQIVGVIHFGRDLKILKKRV
jgi:plasmid stabilization system protein ParE